MFVQVMYITQHVSVYPCFQVARDLSTTMTFLKSYYIMMFIEDIQNYLNVNFYREDNYIYKLIFKTELRIPFKVRDVDFENY